MADLKISQLTGASTPLAGTEVLPIVQSGSTVKVSVANLTAGRAVGMAGGSFTDNITQSTAAKGVNFTANTPAAGMTSQLLNWYEEGTWTVTLFDAASGGNASATTVTGYYTRVGNLVTCSFTGLNSISTAGMTAGNVLYVSLPFAASSTGIGTGTFACENFAFGAGLTNAIPAVLNSNSRALFRAYGSGTSSRSLLVSDVTSGSANIDYFSLSYRA